MIDLAVAPETIDVLPGAVQDARWQPAIGAETLDLLDHLKLTGPSRERLCIEAVSILSQCIPPTESEGQETGLVVGYVQSGKTMSFTTVAALARDNAYALVIVIAGTSVPLLGQSTRRLAADLRMATRGDRAWLHVSSEDVGKSSTRGNLLNTIADWHDPEVPGAERRTILITAMKHHGHLRKVTKTLQALDLHGLPTLIIDDEADQASLNALVLKSDESTTYRRIKDLRSALPHHTYLQYTATPQAPLLINIIDTLSPRFVEVLTPGPDYVGGVHFFKQIPDLVEVIGSDDLPQSPEEFTDPPESLLLAMRLFFVGVAAGLVIEGDKGNRSMMVHPSQRTIGHSEYYQWVQQICAAWTLLLQGKPDDEDRKELLEEFRSAHSNLAKTAEDLPSFDKIANTLQRALRKTVVEEINAKKGVTPKIEWKQNYGWILVGGQAMDRGFTVEGLTVTYMPRNLGVGNADTVQQRARFFGYKRKYLGYCRVFVEQATLEAYQRYVEHEEDVRRRLIAHRDSGAPLTAWKRRFFLDGALKPTRQSVLDLAYARSGSENTWYVMRTPHDSADAVESNRAVVQAFLGGLNMSPDSGHPERSQYARHRVAGDVPLTIVLESLLTQLHVTDPNDSAQFTLLQLLLSEQRERDPDSRCVVYEMSSGIPRDRTLNAKGEITNLFQGADPSKASSTLKVGDRYPGDREIAGSTQDTVIQIHYVNIKNSERVVIAPNVPTVAVRVPGGKGANLLVQEQPNQEPERWQAI
jgi:Z1 domain